MLQMKKTVIGANGEQRLRHASQAKWKNESKSDKAATAARPRLPNQSDDANSFVPNIISG